MTRPLTRFLPLLLVPLLTQGCRKKEPALSNQQLLRAMEGDLFEVKLPSDMSPDVEAGLAMRYADGTLKTISSSGWQWPPGEVIKVVCFAPEEGRFRWIIFHDNASLSGSSRNFPRTLSSGTGGDGNGYSVGERLIRYSVDDSLSNGPDLPSGDDFDVIFHIQKKK